MPSKTLAILVLLLGVAAPLCAQTSPDRLDAVHEFRRYFRKFKTVEERIEAVRTLEPAECPEAVEELSELLEAREPQIVHTAIGVLGGYRDPASFAKSLEELPDMKDQVRRARLIQALGQTGIHDAVPAIVAAGTDRKQATDEVRYAAARAVASLGGGEGVEDMLKGFLQEGDQLVRMGAAEAVGELRLKALGPAIVPLLEDHAWQVQSAAVTALASVREPTAVPALIQRMREGGRLEEECADALFKITGMDFGTDADGWQKQWDRLSSIPGWRIPTDEELAKRAASRKKYDAIYGKRENTTAFGGIPTTSTRILFIIDVSGSMADLVVEKDKFDSGYPDYEKLTIVKTELVRTIEGLGDDTLFNIIAFARDLKPWKRDLVRANVVNRASAKSWVERLEPIGGPEAQAAAAAGLAGSANLAAGKTNTFAALMAPFGVDPDKPDRNAEQKALENPIDTVFFLSDGRPSTGAHTDENVILDEVVRLNDRYKIVFHAIAIGDFQKGFLKSLADQTGGTFVDLGR